MNKFLTLGLAATALLAGSCIKVDNSLGEDLVDKTLLFNTYTVEFNLEDIQLKPSSDLSGYSENHITIGAIRDDVFGLTTRESAFPLIPVLDTIDLGTKPEALSFELFFEADTISCSNDAQANIIQNIFVTELLEPLGTDDRRTTRDLPHSDKLITNGIPVCNGTSDLHFYFTKEYAQKYVDALVQLGPVLKDRTTTEGSTDHYDDFVNLLPGIHIRTDAPEDNGGRINLFKLSCLSISNNYYYRNNNVARLKVRSTWNGVQKDSSFMFLAGEPAFLDEAESLENNEKFYQYAFNRTTHDTQAKAATDGVLIEGGGGLKPVILARELKEKTLSAISQKPGNQDRAVIVKATIFLPFEMPENYEDMKYFPATLSPTVRTSSKDEEERETVSFAGLTDASISTENQGDIDRSNLMYAPDITYHLQEVLRRDDLDTASDADIWLLTVRTEKVETANGSLYDNEYYQQLLYASYYNSLYGNGYGYGGYGGYGYGGYGYGGYGNYSNYYNYMMLAQYMQASSQQGYTYVTELDKDRYYCGQLCGPSSERKPVFRVTFALPKE
jgi:hypothetical protein